MPLKTKKQVFDEWKSGSLHSGPGGPVVKDRRQAIAIALSVQRRNKNKGGGGGGHSYMKGLSGL